MGRGKIQIRRIENSTSRQVTFSKRRGGLIKKAHELSVLCDAEVALIIFSSTGKLFEFASSSMTSILERYTKCTEEKENHNGADQDDDFWRREVGRLKQQIQNLQATHKHMAGEDLSALNAKDLYQLERQLEIGLNSVKLRKDQLLLEQIQDLDRKEHYLHEENRNLRKKIAEVQKIVTKPATNDVTSSQQPVEKPDLPTTSKAVSVFAVQPNHPNLRHSGGSRTALQLGLYETFPHVNGSMDTPSSSNGNEDDPDQPHDWMRWA